MSEDYNDSYELENREWLDSIDWVIENGGGSRAQELIRELNSELRRKGIDEPYSRNTPYLNTIPVEEQPEYPGNRDIERKIKSIIRWNAMAMVVQANRDTNVGGHISTFASAATLWEVGFNHFFRNPGPTYGGDVIFFQGHASPGAYSRAFLEGRINEAQLKNFRRELAPEGGLSSYPHPWLMPDFWQYPTVSMGLGPMMAIYHARYVRYLENRGMKPKNGGKIIAFIGDGETDEPETLGAINLAARENLNNLIFVINCNLQRLDGPVRGNGKIIQELEGSFRGSGWNVIKVCWGSNWDALLERDKSGLLVKRMEEMVDGEYQRLSMASGAYIREYFFGKYPELLELVKDLSDKELEKLQRGGHDPKKVFAAYDRAYNSVEKPTVILAKTVKGYGLGEAGEGKNPAHNTKKMNEDELMQFKSRFHIPISDDQVKDAPFYKPADDSEEVQYLHERRKELGGYLPNRTALAPPLELPDEKAYANVFKGSGGREASTTMSYVDIIGRLLRDKNIGKNITPIVPDEARTFGMEGLFRQVGIYAPFGQLYDPVDNTGGLAQYYRESQDGQILQEGINEDGSMATFIAAGTAYATYSVPTIPFYIYYSMFGFQRVGDFCWAAGDARTKGFLLGATAGRTTLNGEGLQHEDGHSHIISATVPNCVSYDPAYGYELAVILQDGIKRMYKDMEDIFYYITLHNENYLQPAMSEDEAVREQILKGIYKLQASKLKRGKKGKAHLFGSAITVPLALKAAEILEKDYKVATDVWSVTSYTELRRNGLDCDRHNLLKPEEAPQTPYIAEALKDEDGIIVATTDYMKILPEGIRKWIKQPFYVLGTDGYGRSEVREALRDHFEIDERYMVLSALSSLVEEGALERKVLAKAIKDLGINPDKLNPQYA